jgi:heme/copper-type cytochrome/quinol oxidase subunit 2
MNQPLAETIFWIAAVACVIAEAAILRSTFAAQRKNRSELVPASPRSSELAWAVVPALALSAVLMVTWQRIQARENHMEMMDHSGMEHPMPMPKTPRPAPRS